ncbi:MAG: HD domain-containing protein [Bacteroidota bacterium]
METSTMHIQSILEQVRVFADRAHGEQMRKYTPDRYIVHPVRVMEMLSEYTCDVCMLSAALLHDVLEDTPVRAEEIEFFLRDFMLATEVRTTINLVKELTDVYVKADFPHLNRRKRKELEVARIAKTSRDAQTIKYADIIDNCAEIVKYDRDFAGKFLWECSEVLRAAPHGDQALHTRAVATVETAIKSLKKH